MSAHGLHPTQISNGDGASNTSTPSRTNISPATAITRSSKKRKVDQVTETDVNADDPEDLPTAKMEDSDKKLKTESHGSNTKAENAEKEGENEEGTRNSIAWFH